MRRISTLIAGIALTAGGLTMTAIDTAHADAPRKSWDACIYEDGSSQRRCVWNAKRMGNGEGRSFIIRFGGTDDARITYISHRRARTMLNR